MSIEKEVTSLIEKPIKDLGYDEVSVSLVRENGVMYLRVLIDKDDAISLDDIIKVNDLISPLLDEADLIKSEYYLDVSSYGAEKPIKVERLEKYIGKYINIHLTTPYKGENYLEGTLEEVSSDKLVISFREKTRLIKAEVSRKDVDKARLAIKF